MSGSAGTTNVLVAMISYWRVKHQPDLLDVGHAEDPQADAPVCEDPFAFLLACPKTARGSLP